MDRDKIVAMLKEAREHLAHAEESDAIFRGPGTGPSAVTRYYQGIVNVLSEMADGGTAIPQYGHRPMACV